MVCETITTVDFNGIERTEDFYFHLTEAEVVQLDSEAEGGLTAMMEKCAQTDDAKTVLEEFKKIILLSYGEKSPDGRRFIKSKEATEAFAQTEAFSQLYMSLLTDANKASDFFQKVVSKVSKVGTAPDVKKMIAEAKNNAGNNTTASGTVV